MMSVDPSLAHCVQPMRATVPGCGERAGVASAAFRDLGRVSLQLRGIDAVVGLERGIFRMRRSVTSGTKHRAVSLAETV